MIEAALVWLLTQILNYLLGIATQAVETYAAQVELDKQRGDINDANVKAYEAASDRKSRVDAALSLLNGAPVSNGQNP